MADLLGQIKLAPWQIAIDRSSDKSNMADL
jgi:hypothetical protein